MRKWMIGLAALMLSACGGETYPVPPEQAFQTLEGVGTLDQTMLGVLDGVAMSTEALPGDKAVQWLFRRNGDDLARIVGQVHDEGDASRVTLTYADGTAPDEDGRNAKARQMIKTHVWRMLNEKVDATFENREVDEKLMTDMQQQIAMSSMSDMMQDVSASMQEHADSMREAEKESESAAARSTYAATRPTTNLSGY